jgi:hypothetical protein
MKGWPQMSLHEEHTRRAAICKSAQEITKSSENYQYLATSSVDFRRENEGDCTSIRLAPLQRLSFNLIHRSAVPNVS